MKQSKELNIKRLETAFDELNKRGIKLRSVNEMLQKAGMGPQQASNYKNGKNMGAETAKKLMNAYRLNPAYIQFGELPIFLEPGVTQYTKESGKFITEDFSEKNLPEKFTSLYQMNERIEDLQRYIRRIEQYLDDKEKIIRLLEARKD
jgi:transcriptional regulator with XRE-family HTH domain